MIIEILMGIVLLALIVIIVSLIGGIYSFFTGNRLNTRSNFVRGFYVLLGSIFKY